MDVMSEMQASEDVCFDGSKMKRDKGRCMENWLSWPRSTEQLTKPTTILPVQSSVITYVEGFGQSCAVSYLTYTTFPNPYHEIQAHIPTVYAALSSSSLCEFGFSSITRIY